jgi:hypothetical protein
MASETKIGLLEHYERVCSALDFLCQRMDATFRLFVQLSTAVVGGFIWLKMQPQSSTVEYLFPVARFIIPLLTIRHGTATGKPNTRSIQKRLRPLVGPGKLNGCASC